MDNRELGYHLRTLRSAAGRTVASVATEAGLSMPYVANLENGRGNPTTTALDRLASALGTELVITFASAESETQDTESVELPPSLVRFSRTRRFRRDVQVLGETLGRHPSELSAQLIRVLARIAYLAGRELNEADWWRLLDALLLIAAHPSTNT
jgi:transcriptional regulator with XRE-family HTH domain